VRHRSRRRLSSRHRFYQKAEDGEKGPSWPWPFLS
jgi:hypothetical protein